ncbi:MAG: type II toxin-antitoxin system prevent-host-death family antitoxin [Chloroflexota bacterium]
MYMELVPQIEPISNFVRDHRSTLHKLNDGPIILAQRSTPAAVLISIQEWNQHVKELRRLQHLELCDRVLKELKEEPEKEIPFNQDELTRRGLLDG